MYSAMRSDGEGTMKLRGFVLICGLVVLTGCSSIIEGRSQEIVINTNPPGASCTLMRNDMPIGTVAPTPSAILIEKTKYDILVKCDKDGYQEATYFNHSGAAGATFGNIVLGGGIGWAVDSATGSDNKYDSPVNLTMVPEEKKTAHAHHKKASVETATTESKPEDKVADQADTDSQK